MAAECDIWVAVLVQIRVAVFALATLDWPIRAFVFQIRALVTTFPIGSCPNSRSRLPNIPADRRSLLNAPTIPITTPLIIATSEISEIIEKPDNLIEQPDNPDEPVNPIEEPITTPVMASTPVDEPEKELDISNEREPVQPETPDTLMTSTTMAYNGPWWCKNTRHDQYSNH